MSEVLHFGERSSMTLDISSDALIAHIGQPTASPLDDPAGAVAQALAQPVDFPPLDRALVPGDRVAIALDSGLPCEAQLVAGTINALLTAGVEAGNIALVRNAPVQYDEKQHAENDPRRDLPDEIRQIVQLVHHDPAQRDDLGYLAASAKGDPIYINRVLWEADVVLPIGCLRIEEPDDGGGAFGNIYPAFADESSQKRIRTTQLDSPRRRQQRRVDADEAGRWLGVLMAIQVVPGQGDSLIDVVAGDVQAVYQRGRDLCEQQWRFGLSRPASLVVAGIEGGPAAQTWDNFARALASAAAAVEDRGAIVICCELSTPPGEALRRLAQIEDIDEAFRVIGKHRAADTAVADRLLRVLDRQQIFLLSKLKSELVEEQGIIPVESEVEVGRLVSRHPSCTIISNAQLAVVACSESRAEDDVEAASPS